ncbi:MAG: histidine kinase [Nitrosomonadales bacterium]|nr:histidine kinase [Nitrosomonadales bacterium]
MKQNTRHDMLPNFRNLGVTLRILLAINGLALLQAVMQAASWQDVPLHLLQIAALLAPILLASLLCLWFVQPRLERLPYWRGVLAVTGLVLALTLMIYDLGGELYQPPGRDEYYFTELRYGLLSIIASMLLLAYFRWRSQVLSYALHEARLQVLRARIRPHFLFNTINAVLAIVRSRPKQAETALEDMADLFRMAMADAEDLVPLREEIQLCRQYLALEQLRLGERLAVDWQVQDIPGDALIPPLLLQPLLENAVYHGIEPLPQGGAIRIAVRLGGDELHVTVENPRAPRAGDAAHSGNKMALQNIRERLELLFDVEARYQVESGKDVYRVEISLPYMKERV